MKIQSEAIVQMEDLLRMYSGFQRGDDDAQVALVATRLAAAIDRFAPNNSWYRKNATDIIKSHTITNSYIIQFLVGTLKALCEDYKLGYLQSIEGLIQADTFADFLQMAQHLLEEGYKDPALVLVGGVLEDYLRKIASKNNIDTKKDDGRPVRTSAINEDLGRVEIISKLDQKQITAWLALRDKAAHGNYGDYDKKQVEFMIQGVMDFLGRVPL